MNKGVVNTLCDEVNIMEEIPGFVLNDKTYPPGG